MGYNHCNNVLAKCGRLTRLNKEEWQKKKTRGGRVSILGGLRKRGRKIIEGTYEYTRTVGY